MDESATESYGERANSYPIAIRRCQSTSRNAWVKGTYYVDRVNYDGPRGIKTCRSATSVYSRCNSIPTTQLTTHDSTLNTHISL